MPKNYEASWNGAANFYEQDNRVQQERYVSISSSWLEPHYWLQYGASSYQAT